MRCRKRTSNPSKGLPAREPAPAATTWIQRRCSKPDGLRRFYAKIKAESQSPKNLHDEVESLFLGSGSPRVSVVHHASMPTGSSANRVTVIARWGLCRMRRGLGGQRFEQRRQLACSVVPGKFPSQLSGASAVRGLREDAIDCVTHLLRRRIVGR